MRIPIILALIVVLTLPRDVHGLIDTMSTQLQTASASLFKADGPVQVASIESLSAGVR